MRRPYCDANPRLSASPRVATGNAPVRAPPPVVDALIAGVRLHAFSARTASVRAGTTAFQSATTP
jgi:hypothetical protein